MVKRISFAVIAAFWVAMMVLLWRSEFGAKRHAGSPVPVSAVWEKILTAPDASSLQITHRGTNVGYCRWTASVGQEISDALHVAEEMAPEGLIEEPTSYALDLDGHLTLPEFGARLGWNFNLTLDRDQHWQEFLLRLKARPDIYEIGASAAEQAVHLRVDSADRKFNRTFKFTDFQNPQKLLREAGGPLLPGLLGSMGVPLSTNAVSRAVLGLHWTAHQDKLAAGRTQMRVYRLQTRLLDRYRVRVYVSPVGEILRVELPGDILLLHDTLNNLPPAS